MMIKKIMYICGMFCIVSCKQKMPQIEIDIKNLQNLPAIDSSSNLIIRNNGNADLIIEKYTSDCACTVIDLVQNSIIKPHDSLIVKVSIKKKKEIDSTMISLIFKANTKPSFNYVKLNVPNK